MSTRSLLQRIDDAIRGSKAALDPFVALANEAWRDYAGAYAGGKEQADADTFNLVRRDIDTIVAHLAGAEPAWNVEPATPALAVDAAVKESMLEFVWRQIRAQARLREVLLDALMTPYAMARVGLAAGPDRVTIEGEDYQIGYPYIRPVELADRVFDTQARSSAQAMFHGERYRVGRSALLAMLDDRDARAKAERLPTVEGMRQDRGEGDLSADVQGEGARDLIELIDIAMLAPGGRVHILTVHPDVHAHGVIREYQWEGPEPGPFHTLTLFPVRGRFLGAPWIAAAREQSKLFNATMAKAAEQIRATKRVLAGQKGRRDDLETIGDARNGEIVLTDGDPRESVMFDFGGLSPDLIGFSQLILNYHNQGANNPADMAGNPMPGPKRTATEYQGLRASAGVLVEDIRTRWEEYVAGIGRVLCWHAEKDPLQHPILNVRIPGGETMAVRYDAAQIRGDFHDFMFKIRPGTTRVAEQDPQVRAMRFNERLQMVMQAVQAEMATGGLIDSMAFVRLLAEIDREPLLETVVRDPIQAQIHAARFMGLAQTGQGSPDPSVQGGPARGGVGSPLPAFGPAAGMDITRSALTTAGRVA